MLWVRLLAYFHRNSQWRTLS